MWGRQSLTNVTLPLSTAHFSTMNDPPTSESSAAPAFLKLLISTAPGVSCSNHHKPNHPELTSPIADLGVHPALEAALHLANGDLYSAHFLVRKAQGGAKEIDWGHAILHRLEGDWGNSKVGIDGDRLI